MQRPSLLEDDDFSSIGESGTSDRSSADRARVVKLAIAGVLFAATGVIFSVQLGVFDAPAPTSQVSDEVHRGRVDQERRHQEELERLEKAGEIRVDGA